MRKIDQLARDQFSGNVHQTLEHLMDREGTHALDLYVDELTSDEVSFVMGLLEKDAVAYYGSAENFRRELKKHQLLVELNLEEADVRTAKNPHTAPLLLRVVSLAVVVAATPFVLRLGDRLGLNAALLIVVVIGLLAFMTVAPLVSWIKFRKARALVLWADANMPGQTAPDASPEDAPQAPC